MNTFILELFDDEGQVCTFYTVRWEREDVSETDKFLMKYENSAFQRPLQELVQFISRKIGNEKGALEDFFRFENAAHALPPGGHHIVQGLSISFRGFPLRLYCLRLSETLVILFNGGEKTARTAQGGGTSMAFQEANRFAKRIVDALREGEILIDDSGRVILSSTDEDYIVL